MALTKPIPSRACGAPGRALVLEAFIAQHYIGVPVPPLLVTSVAVNKALMDALTEQTGVRVHAIHQPREQRRAWLDMAQRTPTSNWRAFGGRGLATGPYARPGRGIGLAA